MTDRFVIVGASAAGVAAAVTLRDNGFAGELVLLGDEPTLPYERPAVSKELLKSSITTPIVPADVYRERHIDLRLGVRVTAIDMNHGLVGCGDGEQIGADKVLLATGGRARRLSVSGADLDGVCYARDARDAAAIAAGLRPGAKIAVIGGGLIGAEVSASAIAAGCSVTWLEAIDRCLSRALPPPLDAIMTDVHRAHGVTIRTNAQVTAIIGHRRAEKVQLADGSAFECDLVVVGVGIEPNIELAERAGARIGNGVIINERCETSIPGLYAAGDVACHLTDWMPGIGRLEHWRNAQEQGAAAAQAMLGGDVRYNELPWFWTDQYSHHVEACGLARADDEVVVRRTDGLAMSAFYLRGGKLVAAATIDRQADVRAAQRMIVKGLTPTREALANPDVDLRKLERTLAHVVA